MNPADRIRLMHMVEALRRAISFVENCRRPELDHHSMLVFALVYAIQIVGEAGHNVSQETRDQHPRIPWATIIGMRHRLVHAYADIDHDILWTAATKEAPALLAQIEQILEMD